MVVFHDMVETRSGDRHKLAQRYVTVDEIRIAQDQCAPLEELGASVLDLWKEREENQTPDAIIANDADLVDVAVQAKEYLDFGHLSAMEWIDYAKAKVQTATAKKLLAELLKVRLTDWWQGLKKL
jgi:putative hydrolase of HD superfamily